MMEGANRGRGLKLRATGNSLMLPLEQSLDISTVSLRRSTLTRIPLEDGLRKRLATRFETLGRSQVLHVLRHGFRSHSPKQEARHSQLSQDIVLAYLDELSHSHGTRWFEAFLSNANLSSPASLRRLATRLEKTHRP